MSTEVFRTTHMLRVINPNDNTQFVDVKVIDAIAFIDPHDQGQETDYNLDNKEENQFRQVHTVTINGTDGSSTLNVERIDLFGVVDAHAGGQESDFNMVGNMNEPPQHLLTHDFVVNNPTNPSLTITVQRIDQFSIIDPHDQAQETLYYLNNLDDDMSNPSEVDTSDDGTSINPPWRMDPFQNITDVSWMASETFAGYIGSK